MGSEPGWFVIGMVGGLSLLGLHDSLPHVVNSVCPDP